MPFQWPWNRHGQYPPSGANWGPQPWVWVENNQPPPTNPHYQPCPPPSTNEPTTMPSVHANLECPICKILFPPSETVEKITEHVNNHLDNPECCQE